MVCASGLPCLVHASARFAVLVRTLVCLYRSLRLSVCLPACLSVGLSVFFFLVSTAVLPASLIEGKRGTRGQASPACHYHAGIT